MKPASAFLFFILHFALWICFTTSTHQLHGQKPFVCADQFFLTLSTEPPSLNEVLINPQTGNAYFKSINGDIGVSVNAAGYRFTDNFIYCLDPDKLNLIRIDANGIATVLANLNLDKQLMYFAGDITPDGRYLVLLGTQNTPQVNLGIAAEIALVDLQSPVYQVTTKKINVTAQIFDIAFHPLTDVLYGYDSFTQRVVIIDPFSGQISFPFNSNSAPTITGSLFFDAKGNLYAYGSPDDVQQQNTLYRIDLNNGKATYVTRGQNASSSDGCSCPYTIDLTKTVEPKTTLPCSDIVYTFKFTNTSRNVQSNLKFRDNLPNGFSFVNVLEYPITGKVLSKPGDLFFAVDSVTLPPGISELKITVNTGSMPAGKYKNQAVLSNLPAGLGGKIVSDNPETLIKNDSTVVTIVGFPFDTIRVEKTLCSGTASIRLNATEYANNIPGKVNYLWPDGSKNPYLDVSQPGSYLAKLSSGCDSAFVFYQVGSSSIKVQVQKDLFEIKLGENIQIDASVSNSGNQTNFQWIDPQAGSILCTTCLSTSAQPFNDLQYIAIASNELGCTDSALVRVRVKKDRNIYFPNVINPQNAQTEGNGYFYASGDPFTIIEKLSVYSRWGEKLFENSHVALNDPYIGWNGIIRGQAANPGVYVWVAEVLYLDGVRETFQGDVTVVR